MKVELDAVDLCARLSLHETLLTELYGLVFAGWTPEQRALKSKEVIDSLRYNMRFQFDDGDISIRVQTATIQAAKAFFAKAASKASAMALPPQPG